MFSIVDGVDFQNIFKKVKGLQEIDKEIGKKMK